jgi:hypothetical protein
VIQEIEQCTQAWLAECRASGKPTEAITRPAADWFESIVLGANGRWPEKWSQTTRQAALAAARLRLGDTPPGYPRAGQLLTAALAHADDAPAPWTSSAQSLLVLALAGEGRHREAADLLSRLAAGPLESLLPILDGLTRAAANAPPQTRADLAALQLRSIDLLRSRRQELKPAQLQVLLRCRAQALADAGQTNEAVAAYQSLSQTYPRDGAIQEAYAELLATQPDTASLQAALAKWQEVAQKSDVASPRWYRATYAMALLDYRLGKTDLALKLL